MRVWIEASECMGAGTCELIAPDVFQAAGDGTWVVKEGAAHFGTTAVFDGIAAPTASARGARVPSHLVDDVIDAAEQCPAECIHLEV
jgi:ferredoxin